MKRDMDLIRDILLQIEKQDINMSQYEPIAVEGHTPMEVMQHVKLMEQRGLVKDCLYDFACNTCVRTITWEGYDYLELIRQDTIWSKIKKTIAEKGLAITVGTIKTIATAFITAAAEGVANSIIKNGGQV